jgi:hypothetical protein
MKKCFVFQLLILNLLAITIRAQDVIPNNGEDLIRLMYDTYSSNWYPYLTLKQDMFRYRDDSLIRNEVWVVAYGAPGRLHIRYDDFDSGRGWLIINDSIYSFNHNKFIGKRPRLHELITLGLDAYVVPPKDIIPKLVEMKFDLNILEKTSINGKIVYQVGDPEKQCFWISKDDLLFYGIRKVSDSGTKELYFENYKMFYGKPVATQIQYFQDGHLYLLEKYFEIRLPSLLPDSFFDPEQFEHTRW